jgi:amino acid adenylation domain-containing protein
MGVGPEVLVGVCMERSIEMVIALLGVLKAGGVYVPLDPEYPSERLTYMLEDIATPIALTQQHLAAKLSTQQTSIFCLDSERETLAQQSTDNPVHTTTGSNLAYVIYTSGSTGKPKGAMNTHRGICNRLLWMQDAYQLTGTDRVLQKTPYSFDVSVWEFFWPLLTGASLIIARPGGHRESGYLVSTILEQQITTLHFVPSMLNIFLEEKGVERCSSLQRVICSGEALASEHQKRFFSLLDAQLYNLYGPTEAAVDVTAWTCQPTREQPSVPIGQPIANTQIYLLDKHMQPVPVGVPGELYIGGMGLARGYLKQARQTAEKFVPHPFSAEPGERIYRTGDLARYRPDGSIDYLGRLDFQVKLRGQRIELGEIESVLQQYEAVQQGVVLVREESQGDKWLIAYIVVTSGKELKTLELRRYLQTHLPQYMVPSQFVTLDALPLTSNGKIDRRALAKLEVQPGEAREIVLPRTSTETQMVELWEKMLKHSPVSIHDNFFEIGGHSLLATQMISRLRSSLGIELSLKSLFEAPTIASIAHQIEHSPHSEQVMKTSIVPVARTQPLPLSFAQQRLWFLNQLEPGTATYNIADAFRLQGSLNIRALSYSLEEVIKRHETLRTTFEMLNGQPVQIIVPEVRYGWAVIDLRALSTTACTQTALQLVKQETEQPFNLAQGPLFRCKVLRLTEREQIVILTMHHIISDAWSAGVIVHEFTALYAAFMQKKPAPLAPLPIQYADFAAWQHSWLQGEVLDSLTSYWKEQLRGASPLMLPTDRSLEQVKSSRGAKYIFTLPAALSQTLMTLSNQEGVTLFMTLLTAFQALFYRYTGQTDSVIGTDIANRTHEESEKLIGFFVNLLVLRTDLSGKPSFRELLQRVRRMVLDAYAHQDLPFEKLVDELGLERTTQRTPLVNALFVLQNAPMPLLELPEVTISPLDIDLHAAKFDLATFMWEEAGALVGLLNYRTDAFNAHTIETLARRFEALLQAIIAQPDVAIDILNIYSVDELKQKENKEASNHETNRRKLKIARRSEVSNDLSTPATL